MKPSRLDYGYVHTLDEINDDIDDPNSTLKSADDIVAIQYIPNSTRMDANGLLFYLVAWRVREE